MSIYTHHAMTNHHGVLAHLREAFHAVTETLHTWHQRYRARQELTQWTERERHDVGLSWSDVVREAEKPFWRA